MDKFKFYKEDTGKWYIDLPQWEGTKADLEMIAGADTMLDIMNDGSNAVFLNIDINEFEGCDVLIKTEDTPNIGGALYMMPKYRGTEYNLEMWLCEVTRFVFDQLPDKIYIS